MYNHVPKTKIIWTSPTKTKQQFFFALVDVIAYVCLCVLQTENESGYTVFDGNNSKHQNVVCGATRKFERVKNLTNAQNQHAKRN